VNIITGRPEKYLTIVPLKSITQESFIRKEHNMRFIWISGKGTLYLSLKGTVFKEQL